MRNWLSPGELCTRLDKAPEAEVEFDSEKALDRYRSLLYSINSQGKFQFRTRRIMRRIRGRNIPTLGILRIK